MFLGSPNVSFKLEPSTEAHPSALFRFHITRFRPLLENDSVHRNMGQEPVVADLVEAASNVAFENPLWVCLPQGEITLLHRIRTGSSLSETVGVPVSSSFHNRVQSEKVECLHRPVLHCGDSERPHLFAVRFRDVNTSKRLRLVTSTLQLMYRLCLLLRCVPDFSVHTRSFLASIFRHSPNGEYLAAVRVS